MGSAGRPVTRDSSMPEKTIQRNGSIKKLDARPDRIDLRDREFQPSLVSLPDEYPSQAVIRDYFHLYAEKLILDQGKEGACTGFGLAATINYLYFRKQLDQRPQEAADIECVSPRMLYHMARIYDEWSGEDYEGSSCRGAIKGWHRHGACSEELWPYRSRFKKPEPSWQQDAAARPLGAYYRINKDSIADMQAAINEVGAIYVSSMVHNGWILRKTKALPIIKPQNGKTGGHAYAMVGYNLKGFIVQNSWGRDWGYNGFAVLTYEDWVQHGADAWVAVLGAPMQVTTTSRTFSSIRLSELDSGRANWFWQPNAPQAAARYKNRKVEPLRENEAYEHTVVLGNNGRPLNRYLDVADAVQGVREAAFINPETWLNENKSVKLAIYAHGGLNDEAASLKRIRVMAPYFRENNIYPLFITWKTGFKETIYGLLEDGVSQFLSGGTLSRGWFDNLKRQLSEARDRAIEVACEQVLIKSVWVQIKQNAAAAAQTRNGLHLVARALSELKKSIPNLEIHLIGHSAGAILLGHLLDRLGAEKLKAETCTLFAPACSVDFAVRRYGKAFSNGVLAKNQLYCDVLSDRRERGDSVGPYGKSLLYLVSRALEQVHKTPLLGMQLAWEDPEKQADLWHASTHKQIEKWRKLTAGTKGLTSHDAQSVSNGRGKIDAAHGSFDNDVAVITTTLERIRGKKLDAKVESLRGF